MQRQRVLITGAAGAIGSFLVPLVCQGRVCGPNTPVDLVLLDLPQAQEALKGLIMEIDDCAYPLVHSVTPTDSLEVAFKGTDIALMVGGFPRLAGMDRSQLLEKNAEIFVAAGKALEQFGSKTCRVVVVANPANTNCYIMQQQCPSIPKENFTALTRLDHNRAIAQLAQKLQVGNSDVQKAYILGNHSNTMVPCCDHVEVQGKKAELDSTWVKDTFTPTVQTRGAAVIAARQKSSAMSAANAAANHMYDWIVGTDEWVSMAVVSSGQYGTEQGIVYSFPCTCKDGKWAVVEGLEFPESTKAAMIKTQEELCSERDIFHGFSKQ
jgi:malate dehydrogenase